MENPHEAEQAVLLGRIINNVEKCNEAVKAMNHYIQEYLESADQVNVTASLFDHYSENVGHNLKVVANPTKPV